MLEAKTVDKLLRKQLAHVEMRESDAIIPNAVTDGGGMWVELQIQGNGGERSKPAKQCVMACALRGVLRCVADVGDIVQQRPARQDVREQGSHG